ncbi:SPOR domain-containing protein [Rhodovulum marinum]|uniref:Cell division septation protein DedD n=1 Tax=Rhodovulum marinum TaxID=320662 RepID=A0A4R2Q3H6_9RHOB|nr:SPOR domain-containing protein [Rhodovulum marinum]TCP43262.1 cell division septation protein DedD [Rhodovulum marinum]
MTGNRIGRLALALGAAALVAGCQTGGPFAGLARAPAGDETAEVGTAPGLVEREVEAPEVFATTEPGLWDGRPSLGGVWIAHPDTKNPERVMIRNTENGKSIVGALFRREREMPGPRLQVSSDAAAALELLAGKPTELRVVALRREEIPAAPPPKPKTEARSEPKPAPEAAPLAAAAAAIEAAEARKVPGATPPPPRPRAAPAPAPVRAPRMAPGDVAAPPPGTVDIPGETAASRTAAAPAPAAAAAPRAAALDKPFIQIGIFNVEDYAEDVAEKLRKGGVVPTVLGQQRDGKPFWRVVVGPATTRSDRSALLEKVKGLGYTDAYYVTN